MQPSKDRSQAFANGETPPAELPAADTRETRSKKTTRKRRAAKVSGNPDEHTPSTIDALASDIDLDRATGAHGVTMEAPSSAKADRPKTPAGFFEQDDEAPKEGYGPPRMKAKGA